jgi:hypothetical protein
MRIDVMLRIVCAFCGGIGLACLSPTATAQQPEAPSFNGQSLANWMTLSGDPVSEGWEVVDGVIHLRKLETRSGHIVTREEYGDFVLTFDWKIAPGGNSGVKYRVRQYGKQTLGCEYQIYDRAQDRKQVRTKNRSGSLYDVYPPYRGAPLNPPGEFNSAKIVVRGDRLEHWLNGYLVVSATVGDDEWKRRIADSKFSDVPGFGENARGRIMLTDHGSEVWYRNLKLTPISASSKRQPAAEVTAACFP